MRCSSSTTSTFAFSISSPLSFKSRLRRGRLHGLPRHGQVYLEGGARARRGADRDAAAVLFDYLLRYGEPEPRALLTGREERVEYLLQVLGPYALAGVGDADRDRLVLGLALLGGGEPVLGRADPVQDVVRHELERGLHRELASVFLHGLDRVQDDVQEHLLQELGVAHYPRHLRGELLGQPHPVLPELRREERHYLLQNVVHVHLRQVRHGRAGEGQQVLDRLVQAVYLLQDLLDDLLARGPGLQAAAEDLYDARDAGERVLYLVRDAGRH